MNYGESGGGLSASDVALLTGNRNTGGFGSDGDNAWWIILFLIFGWGRNGFGGGFGGGSGVGENYVLATDFATIERKLDGVNAGLCDGFYAVNTGMLNGFAGANQTMVQGFSGINSTIVTNGYETRNAITDLGYALKDCCCQTQRAIDGLNFNMAQNTCAITNAVNQGFNGVQQAMCLNTRDIIENQNANYRALHEELVANKLEAKNERIAELQAQVSGLQLKASQEAQNNYLVSVLGEKCPVPAYVVQPSSTVTFPTNCCGTFAGYNNNGCGCGSY